MNSRRPLFVFQPFIFLLVALPALAQQRHQPMHQRFDDAERWSKPFDDPERDAWQKPEEVIRALKLPSGATVVDLDSGTGYFAVRLARSLPKGRVFGADLEPNMVRYLNERAAREKLPNLSAHVVTADDPKTLHSWTLHWWSTPTTTSAGARTISRA
jgi:cyclopropane fatty-acyl-phospholipid synthase-like methyltransferase